MSFVKINTHIVFSTKYRFPYFNTIEIRNQMWDYIYSYGWSKNINIFEVNGYSDHCHILLSLSAEESISKTVGLLKGGSSYWINRSWFFKTRFEWQDDYFAVSVSESLLPMVRNYIQNQESKHKTKSFEEEYQGFLKMLN